MGVLLNNMPKVSADGMVIGSSDLPDLSKLEVCFGGFSPMALNDTVATNAQIEAAERFSKERREALERAAAIEAARESEVKQFTDDFGNNWDYVVLDESEIKIQKCKAACTELIIPSLIEGKPVVSLAADSCANLSEIETVICPDTLIDIGYCAFRNNKELKKAVLPPSVSEFDSGWFRRCMQLEDLTLPGGLQCIKPNIFDCPSLKRIKVGRSTDCVEPGAFAKSQLESIEVDTDNPFLETDGLALYAKDMTVLVALAVPVECYRILESCSVIAKKAMCSFGHLKEVTLPESLTVVGEYAFSHTGIREFEAPSLLEAILERAFFDCRELKRVVLNEGLKFIGDNAFSKTDIAALQIPSTIVELGHPLAANSRLVYSGDASTIAIAPGGSLSMDNMSGIYQKVEDGLHLIQLEDSEIEEYTVSEGTIYIEERAFATHKKLRSIELPSSLKVIGKAAFKGCQSLQCVYLPNNLRRIESEAFLGANIETLELPRSLEYIGAMALVMHGAHHGSDAPTLRNLTVHPDNDRFRVDSSLLIEILEDGSECVVHCMDSEPIVKVPDSVTSIAPYAFNGDRNIRELYISDRISDVGIRGLAIDCRLDLIHIDLKEPIEGHTFFDIRFPDTDRGEHQMYLGLTVPRFVDVEGLLDHYDNTIVNASNFDSIYDGGLAIYEQAKRILDRLQDPVFMSPVNKSLAERFIASNLTCVCVEIAKHDDRGAIDALCDLGFLNEDNLPEVIECVGGLQDAAMTGYLLELKRIRFGLDAFDFDL